MFRKAMGKPPGRYLSERSMLATQIAPPTITLPGHLPG
jgi:hypothetical protein